MAERKPIGKKMRFEVFKRDKFTCQYCGRKAPDVILEVDHIKPVAEGGKNTILNLITSCRDCNRGKGKTILTVNEEMVKQQNRLQELAEKREQMELLMEWRNELADFEDAQAQKLSEYIVTITPWRCSESGVSKLKNLVNRFSFQEVVDAIDISYSKYFTNNEDSWQYAFDKIGGVCYNRRKQGDV